MAKRDPVDVLFLGKRDNSNRGYIFTKSLEKVGVRARMLVKQPNPHGYPKQAERWERKKLKVYLGEAKVVIWMHSWHEELFHSLKGKKQMVFHGGARYRNQPKELNRIFNPIVDTTLIFTRDLWGHGAKNEVWLLPPIDVNGIRPRFLSPTEKIRIGHFPSGNGESRRVAAKGSVAINRVMEKFVHEKWFKERFEYFYDSSNRIWVEHMERMSHCTIYIEQFRMNILEWGMQALEAAALGNILVTTFASKEQYEKEYGECLIQASNSEKELEETMERLLSLSNEELLELQKKTRRWVEVSHGYEVIGNRFKKILDL